LQRQKKVVVSHKKVFPEEKERRKRNPLLMRRIT
jgi:hypothetical protein